MPPFCIKGKWGSEVKWQEFGRGGAGVWSHVRLTLRPPRTPSCLPSSLSPPLYCDDGHRDSEGWRGWLCSPLGCPRTAVLFTGCGDMPGAVGSETHGTEIGEREYVWPKYKGNHHWCWEKRKGWGGSRASFFGESWGTLWRRPWEVGNTYVKEKGRKGCPTWAFSFILSGRHSKSLVGTTSASWSFALGGGWNKQRASGNARKSSLSS